MLLIWVMLAGGLLGAGVLLAGLLIVQPAPTGPVGLARFEEQLRRSRRTESVTRDRRHETESHRMRKLGANLADAFDQRGVTLPKKVSANLALVGQSRETFLAKCVVGAATGFVAPVIALVPGSLLGVGSLSLPLWLSLLGAVLGSVLPASGLAKQADERKRAFRHVLSAFLDLVAMNLAGGRGVPEALQSAAAISDSQDMVRLRDTLEAAKLQGITPWAALGALGDELDVEELRDLAAALALVAEDGAKVRDSLQARAASMRSKELAEVEGRAAARSQSMLLAQLLLCFGFLLFLMYPALARILA